MTKNETTQLISRISALFPGTYRNTKPNELQKIVTAWYSLFKDFPNEVMIQAVEIYAMQNDTPFGPSPGQLHAIIKKQLAPETDYLPDKYEAWELVEKTMQSADMHYEPQKAFNSLPEPIRKTVGSVNNLIRWSRTEYSQLEYIKNNFYSHYQEIRDCEQDRLELPEHTIKRLSDPVRRLKGL